MSGETSEFMATLLKALQNPAVIMSFSLACPGARPVRTQDALDYLSASKPSSVSFDAVKHQLMGLAITLLEECAEARAFLFAFWKASKSRSEDEATVEAFDAYVAKCRQVLFPPNFSDAAAAQNSTFLTLK